MISERSCDTEDWRNDDEYSALHHRNKAHFKIDSDKKQSNKWNFWSNKCRLDENKIHISKTLQILIITNFCPPVYVTNNIQCCLMFHNFSNASNLIQMCLFVIFIPSTYLTNYVTPKFNHKSKRWDTWVQFLRTLGRLLLFRFIWNFLILLS